MKIDIRKIDNQDKSILINLFQLYLYDITKWLPRDINNHGLYEYNEIDLYFLNDKNREAYFIMVDEKIAGFVLIDKEFLVLENDINNYDIAEFFVMNSYKRKNIGEIVAKKVFDNHKGKWEVRPVPRSEEAYNFWTKVINDYTKGNYIIHDIENDIRKPITFENK